MRVLLVVYDNGSYIHDFPLGLAYLAAVLRKEGVEVTIYQQDIHHYPEDHLREYLNNNKFDIVGVGAIGGYYQYRKLLSISKAVNASTQRPFYILGGHGPAPEPEYFLRKTGADVVVLGEAEETIVELVNAVASHTSLAGIKGISFMNEGKFVLNERRPVIENIDAIPFPAYDLFDMKHYRLLRGPHADKADFTARMIAGRGCTFKCNFCYRMDPGFRTRSHASILEEVKYLQKDFGITYVAFMDELLMGSIEWTEGLCEAFLKAGLKLKWNCNGRLNYAKPKLLKLMR